MVSKIQITDEMRQQYINLYKECYSVSEVIRKTNYKVGRARIEHILKQEGVYEGHNGENYLLAKQEKLKSTMLAKYGVKNWGELKTSGWTKQNLIPYKKIDFFGDEFVSYRKSVEKLTSKNIKNIKKPKYCGYTDILFADEEYKPNPNDPRKRTIDHKIPVLICYLNGITVEQASSINNLVFVLRFVNSAKNNTLHDSFLPIAQKIKRIMIDEGYKYKET